MDPDKLIVLTGVSRGLGDAMAEGFIATGHTVAGCSRNCARLAALNARYNSKHRFDQVDVSDHRQVDIWANSILESHGIPDLVINNAALINSNAVLWEIPNDEFSNLIDVNIKGVFAVTKAFLPAMKKAKSGVIVNFSSGWGRSVAAEMAPYCASKWAIEGLTRALAEELPAGLAAVSLNPGVINTDMLQSCFGDAASNYGTASEWAETAVPFLLNLSAADNGAALTAP